MIINQLNRRRSPVLFLAILLCVMGAAIAAVLVVPHSSLLVFALILLVAVAGAIVAVLHHRTVIQMNTLLDILEASPSGILSVNIKGVIQYANPTACSIFQYDLQALTGMSVENLIPTSVRGRHPELRNNFLRERRSRRMGEGRDIRGVTRTGLEVPLEIGLTYLGEGEAAMIIVGVMDMTALKTAQDTIQRQNQNLARSVKELEQFAFSASHDLREPLRKVMNYVEILKEDYGQTIDEDGNQVLDSMGGAVQRMERLLDSLLSYSRVTTRAQPFERVSLQQVLAEVVEDLSLAISEAGAKVDFSNLPAVWGDRNQLRQLFQNLVSNSLKYRRDDVPVHIRIDRSSATHPSFGNGYCAVAVSDNGIGFDNQYNQLIFDVFKRLHGREKYPGTGMGLAICRKIVERHEGDIRAEGVRDEGAVFTLWLRQAEAA